MSGRHPVLRHNPALLILHPTFDPPLTGGSSELKRSQLSTVIEALTIHVAFATHTTHPSIFHQPMCIVLMVLVHRRLSHIVHVLEQARIIGFWAGVDGLAARCKTISDRPAVLCTAGPGENDHSSYCSLVERFSERRGGGDEGSSPTGNFFFQRLQQ